MPPATQPMKVTCVQIEGRAFRVEVAETAAQKQRGLQFREALQDDEGMMFPFSPPQRQPFWMKDCKIALDLLFFHQGALIDYQDAVPPCSPMTKEEQCPLYTPSRPVDLVIELKAGTRQKLGFGSQSRVTHCSSPSGVLLE